MFLSALQNLLDPVILFFLLGCLMAAVRSNFEMPPTIFKFFSMYLLMAIGFKGGVALSTATMGWQVFATILSAVVLAAVLPLIAFAYLKRQFSMVDAAAIAAAYGSVSAVTFITATQFLEREGIPFHSHMLVAMVLMESPAIFIALFLAKKARQGEVASHHSMREMLREALTDGSQMLLVGSLVIGAIVGIEGKKIMDPFTGEIFKGILALFLLEMGIVVVKKSRELKTGFTRLIGFGLVMPLIGASLAATASMLLGLGLGDMLLLMVLAASASYIVVPAVVKQAIPEANPALYFGAALVITFPFNILIGIPLYKNLASLLI